MRKLGLVLIISMAVPCFAAVNFSAADAGDGMMTISYATDGELPRGVALKVEVTAGEATVDLSDTAAIGAGAIAAGFNTFVDYAYSNPTTFAIGDGHPLAKVGQAGALEAAASAFVISMGVLDEDGDDEKGEAGPEAADPLIIVPFENYGGPVEITISADTYRGPSSGVVGDGGELASNLPIKIEIGDHCHGCICKFSAAGYEQQKAEYEAYLAAGKTMYDLACWCKPYQCDGDVCDGWETILKYRIYNCDIAEVVRNWKKKIGDPTLNPCADIDHKAETILKYRVYTADIAKVIANWKFKDAALAGDCPRPDGM